MTNQEKLILSFSNIREDDLPLVGGKGVNLGLMTHAGFRVPSGFCLTTIAYQQFIKSVPDSEKLYTLLDTVTTDEIESVRHVGQQIRQRLLDVPIPEEIITAIRRSWQKTGIEHAYAIRSSATAEDLPDASFAGQQDTYLNVIGEIAILDAIRRCWTSLFTDRAILYRIKNNFGHREIKLSVVVQRMVISEISGVLFTADPLTGHRHTLVIDASFGLGEALVSGIVSPDAYRVDKRTNKILDRQIAIKKVAIFPIKEGGTRKEKLSKKRSEQRVLKDVEILSLANLGRKIESYYNFPQDIEWAVEDGQIYLLQTRPITSLYPIDGFKSTKDALNIYFSLGHQQSMTRPMSPLSMSTIQVLMPVGHSKGSLTSSLILTSGGRMFADITLPLKHRLINKAIHRLLSQLDALAPAAVKQVTNRPEFKRSPKFRIPLSIYRGIFSLIRRIISGLWKRNLTGFVDKTNRLMDDYIDEISHQLETKQSGKEKLQRTVEILPNTFPFFMSWVPEVGAGLASTNLLTRLAKRWLSPEELEKLTLGISGNVVNEMNMAIGDLADLARSSPQLIALFQKLGEDAHLWLTQAEQLKGSAPFMEAWRTFLSQYGSRGPSEIDVSMPRWYEDPMPVLMVINEFLQREEGRHRNHLRSLVRDRKAVMRKLLDKAERGLLGGLRTRIFKRLYYTMTQVGGMREHHKFMTIRVLAVVKETLKDIAVELVDMKKLDQSDDIWFLTWPELLSIWNDDDTDWGSIIAQRRVDMARYMKLNPPLIITSDGETPDVQYHVADAPEGALLGNPVSSGVVEGVVHIIRDPQRESLAPNEILVAEYTDPGWTPLFINAGALILEVGGALTHGAVVAREYGIPAVVGVRDAMAKLRTGQHVRVDGNRGIIEII